jgi:hypothetical protein
MFRTSTQQILSAVRSVGTQHKTGRACDLCSQQPATGPLPEPDESTPHPYILCLLRPISIIFSLWCPGFRKWSLPNVVVEWLTLLLHIREVPGLLLGPPVTGYPDWDFSWFSSVPPSECRDSTLKWGHVRFLPNPFQYIISHLPYHRRYVV